MKDSIQSDRKPSTRSISATIAMSDRRTSCVLSFTSAILAMSPATTPGSTLAAMKDDSVSRSTSR
jgi:hypothetical protein